MSLDNKCHYTKQRAIQAQNKDTFYEDGGILFCKICNCAVDHSRQSSFDQHKKTKKHHDNKKVPLKKQKITTSFAVQNAAQAEKLIFITDYLKMLISTNTPFNVFNHSATREFLKPINFETRIIRDISPHICQF